MDRPLYDPPLPAEPRTVAPLDGWTAPLTPAALEHLERAAAERRGREAALPLFDRRLS